MYMTISCIFYHLHALDWVSPVAALSADPAKNSAITKCVLATYNISGLAPAETASKDSAYPKEFPKATTAYFAAVQQKVKKIVESGQLGIFSAHGGIIQTIIYYHQRFI